MVKAAWIGAEYVFFEVAAAVEFGIGIAPGEERVVNFGWAEMTCSPIYSPAERSLTR